MPLIELELFTIPVVSDVHFAQFPVLSFVDNCLSICPLLFGHYSCSFSLGLRLLVTTLVSLNCSCNFLLSNLDANYFDFGMLSVTTKKVYNMPNKEHQTLGSI